MNYRIAARSLIGQVRKNNEDNYCVDSETLPMMHGDSGMLCKEFSDTAPHLVGVFDGMGGYCDGEKASFLAASTFSKFPERLAQKKKPAQVLRKLCLEANDEVCKNADDSQMGTTCALLCLTGARYTVCNVGDSPIFLLRGGAMRQLSVDHNQRAVYEKMTGKRAEANQKFKLTQCIGIPKEDMLIEPFIDTGKVHPNDVFLLCSDGLTDMLNREVIHQILRSETNPERITAILTERAMLAGGRDNITVLCVKAEHPMRCGNRLKMWLSKIAQ